MNKLEKLAAKSVAKKKLLDRMVDRLLDKAGVGKIGRSRMRPVVKASIVGTGGMAALMGGGTALTLADPGGKVSKLHKRMGKKYPVYTKRAD